MLRCTTTDAEPDRILDELAVEEPLAIEIEGQPIAVTMRTPGHDLELALGFLLSERVIRGRRDLATEPITARTNGNRIDLRLAPGVDLDLKRLQRNVFTSSSCGLCGKTSIEGVHQHFPPIVSAPRFSRTLLTQLPGRLRVDQAVFQRTGGLHAAAVFDVSGNVIAAREDIGRHNAVDKVVGHALLSDLLPLDRHVLLVSGRASFEIMQKALAARLPVVAAVSAPSSLAVDFAQDSGQTLVGFLREERMNVYSHPARLG